MTATIHVGDCRDVLATLPDASVDAIVTDPPYGLGFMGKDWDHEVPGVHFWQAMERVMKPGAHLLAFGGPRTFHRIAVAIEDAGFEIRDVLAWMFGSGFPKSLDVSKAIDKVGGVSPMEQGRILKAARIRAGMSREDVAQCLGCSPMSIKNWEDGRQRAAGRDVEYITPSAEWREKLADMLGYTADERRLVGASIDRRGDGTTYGLGHSGDLTSGGHTPEAAAWAGWGTALKPAYEPIILARKPLAGTVASNVLTHGTGALNIDGCRIANPTGESAGGGWGWKASKGSPTFGQITENTVSKQHAAGRWPANVVLDEDAAAALDAMSGERPSSQVLTERKTYANGDNGWSGGWAMQKSSGYGDTGGASRFFYVAKASREERNRGLPEDAPCSHPTVKPVALMQWLVRLITPPGGVVLDPFMGSGSTGVACLREGVDFIGIELNEAYAEIARRRIVGDAPMFAQVEVLA